MHLVLYSGGDINENIELDDISLDLCKKKVSKIKIGYIPADDFHGRFDFQFYARHFRSLGVRKIAFFPLAQPSRELILSELFSCDLIHLSGGNTFSFLKRLRDLNLINQLRDFSLSGGVLTGESAGAILMTPSIRTASFPSFDRDDNEVRIRNLTALNLCSFDFFPHFKNSTRYSDCLKKESLKMKYPIIAASDGGGIVVNERKITMVGRCYLFVKGQKAKLGH